MEIGQPVTGWRDRSPTDGIGKPKPKICLDRVARADLDRGLNLLALSGFAPTGGKVHFVAIMIADIHCRFGNTSLSYD